MIDAYLEAVKMLTAETERLSHPDLLLINRQVLPDGFQAEVTEQKMIIWMKTIDTHVDSESPFPFRRNSGRLQSNLLSTESPC